MSYNPLPLKQTKREKENKNKKGLESMNPFTRQDKTRQILYYPQTQLCTRGQNTCNMYIIDGTGKVNNTTTTILNT